LLALGPDHPLWAGPQQLILRVEGERVAEVDYRLDERDELAERLRGADPERALALLERVRPACAHSLALSLAVEAAAGIRPPERASCLRVVAAEAERLLAHLAAVGPLFELMGAERRRATFEALRADGQAARELLLGEAPGAGIVPGGIRQDLDEGRLARGRELLALLDRRLYALIDRTIEDRAVLLRTVDVGTLEHAAARQFGVRGPLARASGIPADARVDTPYAAYAALGVRALTQEGGDVFARLALLLLEALESVKLMARALEALPAGPHLLGLEAERSEGSGAALVEAPLGLLRYTLALRGGRLAEVHIDAPRPLDRLLARALLDRALVDNSLLIAASAAPA
jgi:Ni,Fe-hydrogenase III large subunit